jgi:predicted helicase
VGQTEAVFELFSNGVKTQRDEWMYNLSEPALEDKVKYFADVYQGALDNASSPEHGEIKWDRELTSYLARGIRKEYSHEQTIRAHYRPFVQARLCFDPHFNGMTYQLPSILRAGCQNTAICVTDAGSAKPFMTLATDRLPDVHLVAAGASTQCLPLHHYSAQGERAENITDWALAQFRQRYRPRQETPSPLPLSQGERGEERLSQWERGSELPSPRGGGAGGEGEITKLGIFHYVYAVLHHSAYRQVYELNLKREFPRIPYYDDFLEMVRMGPPAHGSARQLRAGPALPLVPKTWTPRHSAAPSCRVSSPARKRA